MPKFALLVGVSKYEPGLNRLPAAVKDVEAIKQVLETPDIGGFAPSNITVLKNPERQIMEETIEQLFANRHRDDLVLLFFSGHGIKDDTNRLYLATSNTRKTKQGDLIRSSAVSASFVHDNMKRSRSKRQVVILDSCFSGAFAEGLLAKNDGTVNIREELGGEGRAVLTSSTSTQFSFEQKDSELSVYTKYLIQGIKTGEADLNGDEEISIGELHEYATQKVREANLNMKPEIYPCKEGYTIVLAKVPPENPEQKYRKEVSQYAKCGEVTIVGRQILDVLKVRLGLSQEETTVIEDQVLAVSRQKFKDKLLQYKQAFTNALQQDVELSVAELNELQENLKRILGLRNEDIRELEARIRSEIKTYKQHLLQYERRLAEVMRQEYPLSQAARHKLEEMEQQWQLRAQDIALIESRISTEIEIYRQKLQQYEKVFAQTIQQQYPLSKTKRNELRQHQQNLGLKDEDIAPIEARIDAEVKADRQKLQKYKNVLTRSIVTDIEDKYQEKLKKEKGIDQPKIFNFEIVISNNYGQEINRDRKQVQYFTQDLKNDLNLIMVAIPGGKFLMGTEEKEIKQLVKKNSLDNWFRREAPQHEVKIRPFLMGQFQVTQAQWKVIAKLPKVDRDLKINPSGFKGDNRPVERVSWYDAVEFCKRLSRKVKKKYRLPSEAEWEYACRAGTITPFHFGETITDKLANYNGEYIYANESKGIKRQQTTDVGIFLPNAFGLYDMHGNVWEWCEDDWHQNYKDAPINGQVWLSKGKKELKILRGGSWISHPKDCRSAFRYVVPLNSTPNIDFGFRVVTQSIE